MIVQLGLLRRMIREVAAGRGGDVDPEILAAVREYVLSSTFPYDEVVDEIRQAMRANVGSSILRRYTGEIFRGTIKDPGWVGRMVGISDISQLRTGGSDSWPEYNHRSLSIDFNPRNSVSSWSKDLESTENFIYRKWDERESNDRVMVILHANVGMEDETLDVEALYDLFNLTREQDARRDEREVLVLGRIRLSGISWSWPAEMEDRSPEESSDPGTDPDRLDALAWSDEDWIRMDVASNPSTARDTLMYLADDDSSFVLQAIIGNHNVDAGILVKVSENPLVKKDSTIARALLSNKLTPVDIKSALRLQLRGM